MARSTRSNSNKSLAESVDDTLTPSEAEIIRRQLNEKEKQLRAQAEALAEKEMEFNQQREQRDQINLDTRGLENILTELHREMASFRNIPSQLNSLKEQVNYLHNQNAAMSPPSEVIPPVDPIPNDTTYDNWENPFPSPNPILESYPIRLKDVADSIPKYDGQRMSVFQFSKICERALDLIPRQQEHFLVQLIMNKLQGHAYTAIEGSSFYGVAALLRKLKQIFGPNKSLNQYKGELGNAYMKPNESVFDYIARIKELRTAIIDGETELHGGVDQQSLNLIDSDVLDSFINGLPPDLLIRVKLERFTDLEDAYMQAIQCTKTLESEAIRKKAIFRPNPLVRQDTASNSRFPQASSQDYTFHPRAILQRPQTPLIKPLVPGQPGPNHPSTIFCRYCKTPGHLIDNCIKLKYRNSSQYSAGPFNQSVRPQGPPLRDNSQNISRAPVTGDVRRDATEQTGRRTPTVRFQDEVTTTKETPSQPI